MYALVLNEAAARVLAISSRPLQRQVSTILEGLKADPFRSGDFQQADATGRIHQVALLGDWLVTYWSDHAVREIRIVNLEWID